MKNIKWLLVILAACLVLTLAACDDSGTEDSYGTDQQSTAAVQSGNAPNFTVLDENGNSVKLSDFYGKPVVINFWATWCGYCVREMPDFDKAYAENPDVVFLMVNVTDGVHETVDKATAFVQEQGFGFDIYFDTQGQATSAYRITGYPTTVFVNANGDVVAKEVGMISYETLIAGLELITD
ncbi:MAG: TlpA family protein disulfide reductase [Clostridia bacterium]|nr:TlpA family protein disulfide reductase [Clostridia bacterium]